MEINIRECEAASVCPKRVASIARRIEKAALEAQKMGIQVFGGGRGSLRYVRDLAEVDDRALVLADMEGNWSGGDGGCSYDTDGLMRGE